MANCDPFIMNQRVDVAFMLDLMTMTVDGSCMHSIDSITSKNKRFSTIIFLLKTPTYL